MGTGSSAVAWSIEEGSPTGGTISADGAYTAPTRSGTYHVVATSLADAAVSGRATVAVVPSSGAVAVAVSPKQATLSTRQVLPFGCSVTGSPDARCTWSVAPGGAGGTIDAGGLYAAPGSAGSDVVVATSVADPSKSDTATVTVTAVPPSGGTSELPNGPWVTGYYAGWYWDSYPPDRIDMSTMTHFVFGRIAPGGGSIGGTPPNLVFGAGNANDPKVGPGASKGQSVETFAVGRAHGAGRKALAMLGGNGGDGAGFASCTADPTIRAQFVKNVLDYLVAHDYDGVDVDWENNLDAATTQQQLVAFLTELRAAAAQRPRYQAPNAPIVITYPTSFVNICTDLPLARKKPWLLQVANVVDQLNIMFYGIPGFYDPANLTFLFQPLTGAVCGPYPEDFTSSVQAYVDLGISRSKIGVSLGFYANNYAPWPAWKPSTAYASGAHVLSGLAVYKASTGGTSGSQPPTGGGAALNDGTVTWSYVGAMGPDQPQETVGPAGFQADDNEWMYTNVKRAYIDEGSSTYHWDPRGSGYRVYPNGWKPPTDARKPQGYSAAGFLTYQDENSILATGDWVRSTGVGGTLIWMINYGVLDDGTNPLLAATREGFIAPSSTLQVHAAPATATIEVGETVALTSTLTGSLSWVTNWSVQEAGGGTVSSDDGVHATYRAPNVPGVYHVVAASVADHTKTSLATITVLPPWIAVSPTEKVVARNGTQTFVAAVTGGPDTSVTWSVVEAGGGTIDSAGRYTAPATLGVYHVVATSNADPTKSATATVVVASTPTADGAPVQADYAWATLASVRISTSGPDRLLVVTLAAAGTPAGATISDAAGLTWTRRAYGASGDAIAGAYVWTASVPTAISGDTITVTVPASVNGQLTASAWSSAAVGAAAFDGGPGSGVPVKLTLTPSTYGSVLVAAGVDGTQGVARTLSGGCGALAPQDVHGDSAFWTEASTGVVSAGVPYVLGTSAPDVSTRWAMAGVEISGR